MICIGRRLDSCSRVCSARALAPTDGYPDLSTPTSRFFLTSIDGSRRPVRSAVRDWYEAQSPMWVNRFVTAPLPFGVEPVVPPGELGLQLRGGMQFGALGQDFDYTVWAGTDPTSVRMSLAQQCRVRRRWRSARPMANQSARDFESIRCL